MDTRSNASSRLTSRRSFLKTGIAAGAGVAGTALIGIPALAETEGGAGITNGDAAILRFLAAIEIIETDLWQQYNELGGIQDSEVPGGSGSDPYRQALIQLDGDMPQYIHDNTEDEHSHFEFINAYLKSKGARTINLDRFKRLPSSQAPGAQQIGRLTNLMELTVDTSYWTRYRSRTANPDLGDSFPPAIPGLLAGTFPAIPRNAADLAPDKHIQAIANTAGFHFGFIEQGGTSLYPQLAQRVTSVEVLRILLSIGATETMHFQVWHDKAGNAPAGIDPTNGLTFPDLNNDQPPPGTVREDVQTNLIMPEPTAFLNRTFPAVSIIRPTATAGAAKATVDAFKSDGLFLGQHQDFFDAMEELAEAADAATRGF
jgi:Ferritin-like domain/TAT (twin-arginine translocation) pathway signal sequence